MSCLHPCHNCVSISCHYHMSVHAFDMPHVFLTHAIDHKVKTLTFLSSSHHNTPSCQFCGSPSRRAAMVTHVTMDSISLSSNSYIILNFIITYTEVVMSNPTRATLHATSSSCHVTILTLWVTLYPCKRAGYTERKIYTYL